MASWYHAQKQFRSGGVVALVSAVLHKDHRYARLEVVIGPMRRNVVDGSTRFKTYRTAKGLERAYRAIKSFSSAEKWASTAERW
jgi:hypothetical protein